MNITLARIDDRLIHGQVTTVWSKVANAQRIIICNDDVYNDEVRRTLLRQVFFGFLFCCDFCIF